MGRVDSVGIGQETNEHFRQNWGRIWSLGCNYVEELEGRCEQLSGMTLMGDRTSIALMVAGEGRSSAY